LAIRKISRNGIEVASSVEMVQAQNLGIHDGATAHSKRQVVR